MALDDRDLRACCRRAYESGRFGGSWGATVYIVPMVIVSLATCNSLWITIGCGTALAFLCAGLTWRGESYASAVFPGLGAGFVASAIPFVGRSSALFAAGSTGSLSVIACFLGGAIAGAIIVARAFRLSTGRRAFLLSGGAVAALAGSLGCALAGLGGLAGMIAGLALMAPPALVLSGSRAGS